MKKVVFCVHGAVKRVFLVDRDREVVLIYTTPYRVFAERLVPFYERQGYKVRMLDLDVREEAEEARKMLRQCPP
uniref:Uncharacterized protein n=1 Tax=Ignisphaera aggregans TaxID=334771 RepID=A0A7J2U5P9_9CREN